MQNLNQNQDVFDKLEFRRSNLIVSSKGKVSDKYSLVEKDVLKEEGKYSISAISNKYLKKKLPRSQVILYNMSNPKYFDIVRIMDHPYIIKSFEFFSEDGPSWIGEFRYTTLEHYLDDVKVLSETIAAKLVRRILLAINYMHIKKICHRSLSLKNIAFSADPYIFAFFKLFNFTTANYFEEDKVLEKIDEVNVYTSIDSIEGKPNEKCDVWAAGVILYRSLCGEFPYLYKTQEDLEKAIRSGKLSFDPELWKNISCDAQLFIMRLMHTSCGKRYSAREALSDPWLLKYTRVRLDQVDEEVFKRMISFKPKTKLQQLCFFFMVDQLISEEDTHTYTDLFDILDIDHNGLLTKDDLIVQIDSESIRSVMNYLNVSKTQAITYSEFVMGVLEKSKILTDEMLEEGFTLIDQSHDGFIDKKDLVESLKISENEAMLLLKCSSAIKNFEKLSLDGFKMVMRENFLS